MLNSVHKTHAIASQTKHSAHSAISA
jgi:hypothetical protein